MRHLLLFAFVCFVSALLQIYLNDFKSAALELQSACAEKLSKNPAIARDLNRALACGTELPGSSQWKQLLTKTGLYHLVVVSGSHLVLLELALRKFPAAFFGAAATFLLFLTGFQAPLARGLLARYAPISARGPFRVAIVHFLTLFFVPSWHGSLSLALSTAASFGLCTRIPSERWRVPGALLLPWLYTLPLVVGFGTVHPVQLFCNALFAGVLTFFFTPLAYLQLAWPTLELPGIYETLYHLLIPVAALNDSASGDGARLNPGQLSFYLLSLFLLTHFWNVRVLRHA